MNGFKVISFYTEKYKEVANRLIDSLDKFNIIYDIEHIKDEGGWLKNVNYKPKFVQKKMKDNITPLVWIDADAIVKKPPVIFQQLHADIACHFRNDKRYRNECLSGTVFFNNTKRAKAIVDKWVKKTQEDENVWDQRTLQDVLETTEDYCLYRLPASYTQIYDTVADRGEVVIEHFQESRKHK